MGTRAGKCKFGAMAGKYKLGARARAGAQGQSQGTSKGSGAGKYKHLIIKHQIRTKTKATKLVKFLSCFFKWLDCVVLGKLQFSNALQHRFKIFSGTT